MTERSPRAFGLFIDPEQLLAADRYPFEADIHTGSGMTTPSARRVLALASALAASPGLAIQAAPYLKGDDPDAGYVGNAPAPVGSVEAPVTTFSHDG